MLERHFTSLGQVLVLASIFAHGCSKTGCGANATRADINEGRPDAASSASSDVFFVPLVRLLTEPERFVGYTLNVKGYLVGEVQLDLYLTRDSAEIEDIVSAIVVNRPSEAPLRCGGGYAAVVGRFDELSGGDFGIRILNRIDRWDETNRDWVECWKRPQDLGE